MVFSKFAESVNMTIDVPASEKKLAQRIVRKFQHLVKKIDAFDKHLDILYNPFKSHEDVSEDSIIEHRAALRRYRDKINENFNEIKVFIVGCVSDLNFFSYDSNTSELINSFNDSMSDLSDSLEALLTELDNWKDKDYRNNTIKNMETVKTLTSQIEKLINDRIIADINTNILAKNWTDNLDDKLKSSIKDREPYIKKLHDEREAKLKEMLNLGE
jgi:hypothetical protein